MTDPAVVDRCTTSAPMRLKPPPIRLPKLVQGVVLTAFRREAMRDWIKRHGRIFEFNVPYFGQCVAVSDPALVRSVCTASTEVLTNYQPNLSNFFGPGSIFALDGRRHHDRRRILAPAFHGRSLKNHETVIVDEVMRESAKWPENKEFRIYEPMNRITLSVILRTIFGAKGAEREELRESSNRRFSVRGHRVGPPSSEVYHRLIVGRIRRDGRSSALLQSFCGEYLSRGRTSRLPTACVMTASPALASRAGEKPAKYAVYQWHPAAASVFAGALELAGKSTA